MFNAPEIFTSIPDIAQIYAINEDQCDELDKAIQEMDDNIFLDRMHEETIERWEKILELTAFDDAALDDRRFRVKAKILEKLPYSYRVIIRKLDALCPDGYTFIISDDQTSIETKLELKSKKMIKDVREFLENVVPLNMTFVVSIMWNQHVTLGKYTHAELAKFTHRQLREEVFEQF